MNLSAPTKYNLEQVRRWRNEDISGYRTPYYLTPDMQERFYDDVICDRNSPHRYWAIIDGGFIGMGGLTNIQWENGIAEISLIIDPEKRSEGTGEKAVDLILREGFNRLGLKTIYGECYQNNPAFLFWRKNASKYGGFYTVLPNRKFWDGKYWGSLYFSIDREKFR